MELLIVDMANLAFRREGDGTHLVVAAPGLPELARVVLPEGMSDREAVFRGMDAVLGSARAATASGWCRIGLYNPLSEQVAVDAVPSTVCFTDHRPVDIPAGGLLAVADSDGVRLPDGRELPAAEESLAEVQRALAAHRAD
jgi:hypothetical protein